jgi:hypothetical protein
MKSKPACVPTITQSELEEYLRVGRALKQMEARRDILRERLLTAHEAGATVESGPLAMSVVSTAPRNFSFGALLELLGADRAEQLRDRLRPTAIKTLRVFVRK